MPIRLWHQSVTELDRDSAYSRALMRLSERALGARARIETFGLPKGTYGGRAVSASLGNAFTYHRILDRIIDNAVAAEREGYDAFVIGSFSEPFLAECRAVVDIPVVSICEASLFLGCSVGTSLGLITTSADVAGMIRKALPTHGLNSRVGAVLVLDPPLEGSVLHGSFAVPQPAIAAFEAAAERAIAAGADVLVPAEGVIAALLTDLGIFRYRDCPILDVFGLSWSYACLLAEARRSSSLSMTRRGRFSPADPSLLAGLLRQEGTDRG